MHDEHADLNGLEVEAYLKECVMLDPTFLDEEFTRLPADLAYWNERHARAHRRYNEAYRERKRVTGMLWNDVDFLQELQEAHGKRPVKEMIEGAILNHAEYRMALAEECEADAERIRARGVVLALKAKEAALTSLGADVRTERQREPFIKDLDD